MSNRRLPPGFRPEMPVGTLPSQKEESRGSCSRPREDRGPMSHENAVPPTNTCRSDYRKPFGPSAVRPPLTLAIRHMTSEETQVEVSSFARNHGMYASCSGSDVGKREALVCRQRQSRVRGFAAVFSIVPIEFAPHHLHRGPGRLYPRSGLCCLP